MQNTAYIRAQFRSELHNNNTNYISTISFIMLWPITLFILEILIANNLYGLSLCIVRMNFGTYYCVGLICYRNLESFSS